MRMNNVRNFCIIAHIDHGKSTLADRFLEVTKTIDPRQAQEQILDQMDLERERGITIKLTPVTMFYNVDNVTYRLNLIDTPGHVDFSYEVSRSLASVEGAILLVDATQGVQAQTLSTLYLALEHNLQIIPVVNKIDVQNAQVDEVVHEVSMLLGVAESSVLKVSAKTGQGVPELLQEVIDNVSSPRLKNEKGTQALVFDSVYDDYRGVVAYVRVMQGTLKRNDIMKTFQSGIESEILEVGIFSPELNPQDELTEGNIGYIVTGLKEVSELKVGDTITTERDEADQPLAGYKELQPMVFAGIYAKEGHEYEELRESLTRLKLNDASLTFEPHHSPALGFGFVCGFLGMLHLEIVTERLRREYDVDLVVTVPSVAYHVYLSESGRHAYERKIKNQPIPQQEYLILSSALELPEATHIDHIEEPWVHCDIVTPKTYMGNVMELIASARGVFQNTEFLDEKRVILKIDLPLASILVDFYDKLKSVSSGYASYHYDISDYRRADVSRLDIFVAGDLIEALASMVYTDEAQRAGRRVVEMLKETLPRHMFEVRIQAGIGSNILASSRIPALRKDVTAKLYGGDVTRKRKLLEKQKKGKKRMRLSGAVDIPQEAYLAVLKR